MLLERSRNLFARKFQVQGMSMEPAFKSGDWVKIHPYIWGPPIRREVVALRPPHAVDRLELKRVIGLPGETVSWRGCDLWINNHLLEEPYAIKKPTVPGDEMESIELGLGEYFLAGDNRLYSQDSRLYGPVRKLDILGLANHTRV
jgi:signal peptidase I